MGDRSTYLSRVRKTVMFNEVTTSWGKWFHIGITRSVKNALGMHDGVNVWIAGYKDDLGWNKT